MQEKKLSEDIVKDLSSDLQVTWSIWLLHNLDAFGFGNEMVEIWVYLLSLPGDCGTSLLIIVWSSLVG